MHVSNFLTRDFVLIQLAINIVGNVFAPVVNYVLYSTVNGTKYKHVVKSDYSFRIFYGC